MQDELKLVERSFGRCCGDDVFWQDFYRNLLSSSNEVRDMFKNTDPSAQRMIIRNGVSFAVMFAKNGGTGLAAERVLTAGKRHRREELNVRPELYKVWFKALLKTLEQHDPSFDQKLANAWEKVLEPTFKSFTAQYGARSE